MWSLSSLLWIPMLELLLNQMEFNNWILVDRRIGCPNKHILSWRSLSNDEWLWASVVELNRGRCAVYFLYVLAFDAPPEVLTFRAMLNSLMHWTAWTLVTYCFFIQATQVNWNVHSKYLCCTRSSWRVRYLIQIALPRDRKRFSYVKRMIAYRINKSLE